MNKIAISDIKTTYEHLKSTVNTFVQIFDKFAKDQCTHRGEICTCYHPNNEHLINIIGGAVPCRLHSCPYMREEP